ncbi:MAG: hypothetical protein EHM88_21265, partial [Candidatus Rokuibacteriota bacterium]
SNYNLVVRATAAKTVTPLSTDGSAGNAYDPESIVWSPDSAKLAAYLEDHGWPGQDGLMTCTLPG